METQPVQSPPTPAVSTLPHPPTLRLLNLMLILLAIALVAGCGFLYLENMNLKKQLGITPKPVFPKSCEYEGVTYQPGESMPSIDNCNSCACDESGQVACTTMACEESNKTPSDAPSKWATYTSVDPAVKLTYPPNYVVSGRLASSLQNWDAGRGITITDPSNPAQPTMLIEAVYDGYGPFFPTGTMQISFEGNQMKSALVSRISETEYQEMIANGYIEGEKTLYQSNITDYKGIPIWVRISYNSKTNTDLDEELMQILSNFEFTD